MTQKPKKGGINKDGATFAILVGTGILLFFSSFGGLGGLLHLYIIAFAVFSLVIVNIFSIISKSIIDTNPQLKGFQTIKAPIIVVAIVSGIIGIIIVFLYQQQLNVIENSGINVQWNYYPKPEDSPIEKFTSDGSLIMVKTQSEQYYSATAQEQCYVDSCWFKLSSYENKTYEDDLLNEYRLDELKTLDKRFNQIESTTNDPNCYAKSFPLDPPEGEINDNVIFRGCPYGYGDVSEVHIIAAKDGGLWIGYHRYSRSNVISNTFWYSIFIAPIFALIGVLLFKQLKPRKN